VTDDESVQQDEQANSEQHDALVNLAPADWATADEIRRRRFSHVAEGYSPDEVHAYLGHLAETFATLRSQIDGYRHPASGAGGVSDLATRMADLLREAEGHAATLQEEADRESTRLLAEARQDSERILSEARQEADRTVVAARDEAERATAARRETARESIEEAERAVATATEEAARVVATAQSEADRIRAGAEQEAAAAREEADRKAAAALEFRDTVLTELRETATRIESAAPRDRPAEATRPAPEAEVPSDPAGTDTDRD
jgi:DivIVA domain-containing protein